MENRLFGLTVDSVHMVTYKGQARCACHQSGIKEGFFLTSFYVEELERAPTNLKIIRSQGGRLQKRHEQ